MVSDESKKIRNILLTKKTKFLLYTYSQLNIGSTTNFFCPNKINCTKNNIIILKTNQNSTR